MRPQDPSGFSGPSPGTILLRTKDQKHIPIDYELWGKHDDFIMTREETKEKERNDDEISGPWLDRWRET